ncbi:hypothetical protein [Pseudomonas sp. AB12(2023)]|uniref:hypothetical protein n=1 Tax=Pseudomonas sp. AB12(2023) TaxID=3048597 RepID=UPI002B22EBD3|nr:hypothetical protein [Pseudomonas sp. AB12(2023)]MEB0221346.1 hypothetical protein [Pseudomonas sp. AB12(2023)]
MVKVANTNEKAEHIIELSTIYFYQGVTPRTIALKDCGLKAKGSIKGAFSALYGYQSKQEAFMAARSYANERRLDFTVIDLLVKLDTKQNPLTMKPEDLASHDFISFQRLSRSMMDDVQDVLRAHLLAEGTDPDSVGIFKPHIVLMQRPDLVAALMNQPSWEHLKVIAHPADLEFSARPLNVGTVPFRHWDAIQEATCRLNPNIRITLEPPAPINSDSTNADAPSPQHKAKSVQRLR